MPFILLHIKEYNVSSFVREARRAAHLLFASRFSPARIFRRAGILDAFGGASRGGMAYDGAMSTLEARCRYLLNGQVAEARVGDHSGRESVAPPDGSPSTEQQQQRPAERRATGCPPPTSGLSAVDAWRRFHPQ